MPKKKQQYWLHVEGWSHDIEPIPCDKNGFPLNDFCIRGVSKDPEHIYSFVYEDTGFGEYRMTDFSENGIARYSDLPFHSFIRYHTKSSQILPHP